jgi:vancomycin resistance protein YoaR
MLSRIPRSILTALAAAGAVIALVTIVFAVDRITDGGEVLGDVQVAGVDLGGLSERQALEEVRALEERLRETPIPALVAGHVFELTPAEIGLDLDEEAIVDQALAVGREGGIAGEFAWWAGSFMDDPLSLDLPYTFDTDALTELIAAWEVEGLDSPAFAGDVWMDGREIRFRYPNPGTGIDADSAIAALEGALVDPVRTPVELQTRFLAPDLTDADVDAAVARAQALLADDIVLRADDLDRDVVVPQEVLADSLVVRRDDSGEVPEFRFRFRTAGILEYVNGFAPYLETEAVDAQLVIDVETDEVRIEPSVPANAPDPGRITNAAWQAANDASRTASLRYREGREADFSTADAEALGVKELIGEFTTFHACCESRVTNIQLIASATDGAIVYPGETWNLNDHVGERTREKGYLPAGAIIGGELYCCDDAINIGGGTSQWTTTLYNAIFFAGLEDVDHTPHSIYFTRYPEGREATLGFPAPNLAFRNNTDHVVILKSTFTDTSITAKIYGDNGGIEVEAGLSDRYNFTGIRRVTRPDPDVAECTEKVSSQGSGGWSVDIYRYITHPDGTETTEEWTWRYSGAFHVTRIHPVPAKRPDSAYCKKQAES